jgi:hypothetical protein
MGVIGVLFLPFCLVMYYKGERKPSIFEFFVPMFNIVMTIIWGILISPGYPAMPVTQTTLIWIFSIDLIYLTIERLRIRHHRPKKEKEKPLLETTDEMLKNLEKDIENINANTINIEDSY